MSSARQDKFIEALEDMREKWNDHPEYAHILKLLIEQVKQGKLSAVQSKLKQLQKEDW